MIAMSAVSKSYAGRPALRSLTLTVGAGETYGLLGPNGAGKTTTIHLLAGLLAPDSGTITVAGCDVVRHPRQVWPRLGYVAENVALYPFLTGRENLDYFSRLAGVHKSPGELERELRRVGLPAAAVDRRSEGYSKGMRQKVGIAIALAKGARVLLLDEPASGLDPHASHELSRLIRTLAHDGVTTVMATHDLFRARETCDHIGLLIDGERAAEVRAAELSANDLERLYLDHVGARPADAANVADAGGAA